MKYVLLLSLSVLPLMACKTTVDGRRDQVIIQDDGYYHEHPHDGKFCPPGQAKKGNC